MSKPQKIEVVSVDPRVKEFLQEFYRDTTTEVVYVAVNVDGLVVDAMIADQGRRVVALPGGDYLITKIVDAPLPPGSGLFAIQAPQSPDRS